ncbi:MAG: ribosome silencing factor [Chitinophagales bacterium]
MSSKIAAKNKISRPEQLKDLIVDSIQEKKGEEIVVLDLRNLEDTVTDFFVICHAQSNTQVRSISDFIMDNVVEKSKEKAYRYEGMDNLEWVIIDYVNVVVHVFVQEKRTYYKLEELWADAVETQVSATH